MAISKDMTTYNLRIRTSTYEAIKGMVREGSSLNKTMLEIIDTGMAVMQRGYDRSTLEQAKKELIECIQKATVA